MGYGLEVDMIRSAHELDLLTAPYVFDAGEAQAMAEAGADVLVPHMGLTTGGAIGAESAKSLEDCVPLIQEMHDAAKRVNPEIIVLCHGGPIAEPDDAAYILDQHRGDRRLLRRLVHGAAPDGGCDDGEHAALQGDRIGEARERLSGSGRHRAAAARLGRVRPGQRRHATGCTDIVAIEATFHAGQVPRLPLAPRPGGSDLRARRDDRAVGRAGAARSSSPGDAVVIAADVVHATFNDGDEAAKILAILSPASPATATRPSTSSPTSPGRRCEADDARRPRPRRRRAPLRGGARPGPGPRRGRRRAAPRGAQPARHVRAPRRVPVPAAARPGLRRRRRASGHGRGGRHPARAALGPRRGDAAGRTSRSSAGPRDGTYAELVALPAENLYPKPSDFSWDEAAAFPLAALTAYRALFYRGAASCAARPCSCSERAAACRRSPCSSRSQAGARVLVTSSSDEKLERARELGADGGVNYATNARLAGGGQGARRRRPRARLGRLDLAAVARLRRTAADAWSSSAARAARR